MSKTNFKKVAACTLALTLAAIAAQPADAVTRHHHPQKTRTHAKKIAKAQPTQIAVMDGDLNRQSIVTQAAMTQIRAQLAQQHVPSMGTGITVACLDGGFDLSHEALAGHITDFDADMVDMDGDSQDLGDGIDNDNDGNTDWVVGHGTFVASLVLAVAPNVTILPIRVFDDEGWGTEQSVADGVNYAVSHGAAIINLSLVVEDSTNILRSACRNAIDGGSTITGSAGNEPGTWYMDPIIANQILTVGAVNGLDVLLPWSVTGGPIDLYAPGELLIGAYGGSVPNSYARWSGTSFSAPLAAGGAALLKSAHPTWTPSMITNRLKQTADPAIGVLPMWGHGRLNLGTATQ